MIIITGVPKSGKSIFTDKYTKDGKRVFHTDDMLTSGDGKEKDWSEVSREASYMIDNVDKYDVLAGNAMVRALRKWLTRNPKGAPAELVIWMGRPREELTHGEKRMESTCNAVWKEIRPELRHRGQKIIEV